MNNIFESPKDAQIFADRVAQYNLQTGPRVGDFIKFPDGKYQRFTYKWHDQLQAGASAKSGSFYLGEGYIEYSGGLNSGAKRDDFILTDETKYGDIWFFHNNHIKAHNSVHYQMAFRVFELKPRADVSGLYHLNYSSL